MGRKLKNKKEKGPHPHALYTSQALIPSNFLDLHQLIQAINHCIPHLHSQPPPPLIGSFPFPPFLFLTFTHPPSNTNHSQKK